MAGEWPVDAEAIEAARAFLDDLSGLSGRSVRGPGRVAVAAHNDADGLSAAVIVLRALAARGIRAEPLIAKRGEHVHQEAMRKRIAALNPDALIVVDIGTRRGTILDGVPTLLIDHHDGRGGLPTGAVVVNGYDREPVASSSVLAYAVCCHIPAVQNSAWLGAFGAVGDLGTAVPFSSVLGFEARGRAWSKAVALINAARRAPADDAMAALRVLERAESVEAIASGRVSGVDRLQAYSTEVQEEIRRCSRVAPRRIGDAALIRFSSGAQVHPIIATRWSRRLAPAVVIAANDGFISGRVNFAIRSSSDINLLEWLRGLPFTPSPSAEYANGHPRATGGSLPPEEFECFIAALKVPLATPDPRQ